MTVDRRFFCVIRDEVTGPVLFLGIVARPG